MTWDELAEKISEMTPEQRRETALIVDGSDDDATVWEFGVHQAQTDIWDSTNMEYPIRQWDFFLADR